MGCAFREGQTWRIMRTRASQRVGDGSRSHSSAAPQLPCSRRVEQVLRGLMSARVQMRTQRLGPQGPERGARALIAPRGVLVCIAQSTMSATGWMQRAPIHRSVAASSYSTRHAHNVVGAGRKHVARGMFGEVAGSATAYMFGSRSEIFPR